MDRALTLRYRFANRLYQKAFYESMRVTRRAALRRALAEQLVSRLTEEPSDCAANIALLFEAARENVRAAEYFNIGRRWQRPGCTRTRRVPRLAEHGPGAARRRSRPAPARNAAELSLQMTSASR